MRPKIIALFTLTSAGLLFSGYMSGVKLLSGSCAFNESCPYFLGYPACWYGFAMYVIMFMVTSFALAQKGNIKRVVITDTIVSFLGILFSGSFVAQEIARSIATGVLDISTCVYGLIFYIAIFIVSLIAMRSQRK